MGRKSTLYRLIQKEYQRLTDEIDHYEGEIKDLAKGTIRIMSGKYVYLCYKKDGKMVSEYKGMTDSEEAIKARADVKTRSMYKDLIKQLRLELEEVEGYLKAGKRFYKKYRKEYEPELELGYEDERG